NMLTGRAVTWNTSSPQNAAVSAAGLVTAVAAGVGTVTITETSEWKTGSAGVSVTAVAGVATQIAILAGNNQSATVGKAVATSPSVIVKDANNNPVSGV